MLVVLFTTIVATLGRLATTVVNLVLTTYQSVLDSTLHYSKLSSCNVWCTPQLVLHTMHNLHAILLLCDVLRIELDTLHGFLIFLSRLDDV